MAEKSSEEYLSDNTDNTSEVTTPSNNTADTNNEDTSGTICTITTGPGLMPGISYSIDDPSSDFTPRQLSIIEVVSAFFDKFREYKIRSNGNINDSNMTIDNTDHRSDIDINLNCMPYLFLKFGEFPDFTPQLPLLDTLTPQLNLEVNFVKQGQEYIDFMSVFTEHEFCKPFLEKIFSYLSYKDITSMTSVSTPWRKAVLNSTNAQKELEKVFIHAILYFCHKNANATDEYKQLYNKILIHFKNQIQFRKNDF